VNPLSPAAERSGRSAHVEDAVLPGLEVSVWEQVLSPGNLGRALRRVEANRGAPGVDGMTTDQLRPWLHEHWVQVREALDAGTYQPSPVRRVVIPKPGGGERLLGVPTEAA
jgi:RNA-directed DNA polymerase